MLLLDRLFARRLTAADIERVAQSLPSDKPPADARLRCIATARSPMFVCDWMEWSLWQDKRTHQIWVHCTGGIADVDVWYGPGDPQAAAEPKRV